MTEPLPIYRHADCPKGAVYAIRGTVLRWHPETPVRVSLPPGIYVHPEESRDEAEIRAVCAGTVFPWEPRV